VAEQFDKQDCIQHPKEYIGNDCFRSSVKKIYFLLNNVIH